MSNTEKAKMSNNEKTKMTKSLRSSVLSALILFTLLVWAVPTAQASLMLEVDTAFSGASFPEGSLPWLTAEFVDAGTDQVTLTLTSYLTDAEHVKVWAFNLDPSLDPTKLTFTLVSGVGFTAPVITTGTDFYKFIVR